MLTDKKIKQALINLALLRNYVNTDPSYFSFEGEQLSKNWFLRSSPEHAQRLKHYIDDLCDFVLNEADFNNKLHSSLYISLQNFFHLQPNAVLNGLNPDLHTKKRLARIQLTLEKIGFSHPDNQFKAQLEAKLLPLINYDPQTGLYTSPDDDKAHQHGSEARRIFFSTQWERFKAFCNYLFAKINIFIFESARYKEHDYLDNEVYAHDTAIDPDVSEQNNPSHYWIGHASSLITIPTDAGVLNVVTDPVEGDLAPVFYPRMTEEGNLIDGPDDKRLPKIDVVIISHNHRDHVSEATLKRLLKQQPKMIVPEGDEAFFLNLGFTNVVGLKWWEQARIQDANGNEVLKITAVPTRHWSGRTLTDAHHSAFNGYILQAKKLAGDIYFAGDTALMDDAISRAIFEHFNVVTSIQPGGPDERREDMESTHQSSADGILMHFKILAAAYSKMKKAQGNVILDEFLEKTKALKTIYNHTSTFKLGNLRLKDTHFSFQRLLAAFHEGEQWRKDHLPPHEHSVYDSIQELMKTMTFEHGVTLSNDVVACLIQRAIVIPKIGQRQELYFNEWHVPFYSFQHRDLITNYRALIEFDAVLKNHVSRNKEFNAKDVILDLLSAYHRPKHAFLTRTYQQLDPLIKAVNACRTNDDLWRCLQHMEDTLGARNQHGHMQSLLHYGKWLISFANETGGETSEKFKEFFACKEAKELIDKEIHNMGSFFVAGNRKPKQLAFQSLSDQLTDAPMKKTVYQDILSRWLKDRVDDQQTTKQLLSANRSSFFQREVPHSLEVVNQLHAVLI